MRCFLTARDGPWRLAEHAEPGSGPGEPGLPWLQVDPSRLGQTILGFGGAFTESAAVTWARLGPALRGEFLRACFDPLEGHGYTLGRVPMGSCDFALGNYAHLEPDGAFSLARDRQALIPFLRAAQGAAGRRLRLLASPWSPPAWMKTTGEMNLGGALRPACRPAWAQCYVRFIQGYAAEGLDIWGVTVQNEPMAAQPWDSCLYTAEEERDFVRDHLGPALAAAGLGQVRILVWDHNRDQMAARAAVIYADPEAARFVWGTAFHWYGEDCFEEVAKVRDAWPGKHLLFTEGCQEGGPHLGSWDLGERYARSMIQDLNHGAEGWLDWNLLLDHRGGPNHTGNLCSAPILASAAGDELLRQSSYYYLGHFSRFVRPGARLAHCEGSSPALEAAAFRNPGGGLALVALNRTDADLRFELRLGGTKAVALLPAHGIATYLA